MSKAIEYGIRGKSQKNIVQYHGSSKKTIEFGIKGSAKKSIEYGLQTPKSDFELPRTGKGIEE
jgi:hypothetical protein